MQQIHWEPIATFSSIKTQDTKELGEYEWRELPFQEKEGEE